MTRRSRREIENALDALEDGDGVDTDRCSECGGVRRKTDAGLGVTAPFVTYECTCDADAPTDEMVIGR